MTTIAWDGQTLAVDRGTWSGRMAAKEIKLHLFPSGGPNDIPPGALATTGTASYNRAVVRWLRGAEKPTLAVPEQLDDDMGLYVDNTGQCYAFYKRLVLSPIESKIAGAGGGALFVLGAMMAGMTAVDAVLAAAQHTDCSFGGVSYWTPGTTHIDGEFR